MSLAEELLLVCAKNGEDASDAARLRVLVAEEGVDWEWLVRKGLEHGVMPLAAFALLRRAEDLLPDELVVGLRAFAEQNERRSSLLWEETLALVSALRELGVDCIPIKGAALGQQVYGKAGLRQAGDIDMLVRASDVDVAKEMLVRRGYRPAQKVEAAQEAAYRRYYTDFGWWHEEQEISVELHWKLTPFVQAVDFDVEALWERSRIVEIGGERIRCLAPEEYFLFLCVHGSKHLWSRLLWLCDVKEFREEHRDLDWDYCRKLARGLGAERMLLLGVGLTERLFGVGRPAGMVEDTGSYLLCEEMAASFFEEKRPNVFEAFAPFQRLRERRRHRFLYWWRHVTTPRVNHLGIVRLARPLWPLYTPIKVLYDYGYKPLFGRMERGEK